MELEAEDYVMLGVYCCRSFDISTAREMSGMYQIFERIAACRVKSLSLNRYQEVPRPGEDRSLK